MKKFLFSLFAATVLFTSCSEKFEVAAPYKDITLVYGFLDVNDTAHYIRIQKAFLDEEKSAVSMAQTSDSNFFNSISVRIERYRAAKIGGRNLYVDSFHIDRVNMDNEGYPKQPGPFFTAPNYAYKFTDRLDSQYIYRLKITHLRTGKVDSADAPILPTSKNNFMVDEIDNNLINIEGMEFSATNVGRNYTLSCQYKPIPNYDFNGENNPARLSQAIIRFNWDDSNINTKLRTPRFYDYDAGYVAVPTSTTSFGFKIPTRELYNAISTGMGAAPDNVVRLIDRVRISVYVTTSDYANYRNAILIRGNGLTGSEISSLYTNIKGENTLGLFTSRVHHSGPITITKKTVDSLIASPLLKHTNIRGTTYR
jgi:hypothetical protein